ncbi:MAG TPA: PilZ domain-containing protein [Kofleriaceae bacterium]|nr:PilZ domain-containing protein [Kofleriaceae bacterium]
MSRERRNATREAITARVTLRYSNDVSVLEVDNISAGGIFLKLAPAQRPMAVAQETVTVYFDVGPDAYGDPLDLEVDAEVVRVDLGGPDRPAGIALMWTSTDPAVPERLALVLDHLRGR